MQVGYIAKMAPHFTQIDCPQIILRPRKFLKKKVNDRIVTKPQSFFTSYKTAEVNVIPRWGGGGGTLTTSDAGPAARVTSEREQLTQLLE